jgi:hypothetical protein
VRKKYYKGQDTIVYDSNLDRVPWVVSTVSCPQALRYCKSAAIGHTFSTIFVSFESVTLLLSNHQSCHFSAIWLNTGIFLDWPIREILSLFYLPNCTKVTLFCYSARYQYHYFQAFSFQVQCCNLMLQLRTRLYLSKL